MIDMTEENEYGESHFQVSEWVLKTIFTIRKDLSLEEISERIWVPYSTMKKYRAGKMPCPVEILKKIYQQTRHPLLKELLEPEGFEIVPRDSQKCQLKSSVEEHIVGALGVPPGEGEPLLGLRIHGACGRGRSRDPALAGGGCGGRP